MSISHLRGCTLASAIPMEQKKSEVSKLAEQEIKAVNPSYDLPSTSCNMTAYMHFLSPNLLSNIRANPNIIENCLKNLDVAIKNDAEKKETKAKCVMVKMLLEGNSLESVFDCRTSICSAQRANLRLGKKESLPLMLEYYLTGGLKLLRGFPCAPHSTIYPASAMNFILKLFEKNPVINTSGFKINSEIKKRIERGEYFETMDAYTIPTPSIIDSFIANCGYKKNPENQWFFSRELTASTVFISPKRNLFILPKLQQTETEQNILTSSTCNVKLFGFEHSMPAMLVNLEAAIENDFEKDKDKFKFVAVKMLLTGFTYKQTLKKCHELYSGSIQRNISWTPARLDLLLHNFLLGGLRFLRAFSFKSNLIISQLKTMRYIVDLVEANPEKGSSAILNVFNHMKSTGQIPLHDRSSFVPSNNALDRFLVRCGYKRSANKWIFRPEFTPNIHLDGSLQIQISGKQFSLDKIANPNLEHTKNTIKETMKSKDGVSSSKLTEMPINPLHFNLSEISPNSYSEKNAAEYYVKPHEQLKSSVALLESSTELVQDASSDLFSSEQSLESVENDDPNLLATEDSTMHYELLRNVTELIEYSTETPQKISFSLASLERGLEQVENIKANDLETGSENSINLPSIKENMLTDKVATVFFDEKMIAHEKALEANEQRSEKNSLAELTRLMLSFESLSSCSSKCSLEEISDHIENSIPNLFGSQPEAIQDIHISANTGQALEINPNELIPLPNIDSRDFFDPSYQFFSQEMQAMMPSVGNEALSQYNLNTFDWNYENSHELELQPSLLEKPQTENNDFLSMIENPFLVNEAEKEITLNDKLEMAYKESSVSSNYSPLMPKELSLKEQIDILKIAMANDSESDINRIKFTAVKMFLEGECSNELIAKICNSLFIKDRSRHITWNQERFTLLSRYYLNGGLALLRGFSFKSFSELASAETMGLIIRLVETHPEKGSVAILKILDKMNKTNKTHADANTLTLPSNTALDKFLIRCGYQRIQKKWVFNTNLTTNILPNDLRKEEVSNSASFMSRKATKRRNNEKLQFIPNKRIRESSVESKLDSLNVSFLNQDKSDLMKSFSANLQAAIDNDFEKPADNIKFTAIKMLIDGYTYGEILQYCNFIATKKTKKNILWTRKKLDILLEHYLQGGLWLVRAFSFQSYNDTTLPKKMGLIMKLVNEDPEKGSAAILNKIYQMNEAGQISKSIDVSSLPCASTLDIFILRAGYQRISKERWIFKSHLTPNLPFYGLQKEPIIKQIEPRDQSKTASKQSSTVTLKFH